MPDNKNRSGSTIYCHFSFRRPKNKPYGIFAVAFYRDFDGKKLITSVTRKYDLWEDHQFITAIQSYEHALQTISEMQGMMQEAGIKHVMLVTDNSILAGWIMNHKKNSQYTKYMDRAVQQYRAGAPREITLGIGLCEVRKAEKSYKYCQEARVSNDYRPAKTSNGQSAYKLDIGEYKSIDQILKEDPAKPEISGIKQV